MTTEDHGARATAAFEWATGLVALARRLVGDGVDVDLSPVQPAINELCQIVKSMPAPDAAAWLDRLMALQQDLASLAEELAARERARSQPE
jgi:hypothetical protein